MFGKYNKYDVSCKNKFMSFYEVVLEMCSGIHDEKSRQKTAFRATRNEDRESSLCLTLIKENC